MAATLIENVSDTAFWIAYYRAVETERPDALFRDPLAARLAGDHGKKIARTIPMGLYTSWSVVIRTCIIDDYIRFAIGEGVDTVLNLGAGLDTRPYRMDLPESLLWVEADYPRMIEFKEERLRDEKPRCRLERVKVDLADVTARQRVFENVNERAKRTLVLTEGVIPYLSSEDVGSLADDLKAMDHVRYWIVDYFSPMVVKYRRSRGMRRKMQNAPFKFVPEDWFGFFAQHGWNCKEMRYLTEEAERRGRPIQLPLLFKTMLSIRRFAASKKRRAAFGKFAGYVLLERGASTVSRASFQTAYAGKAPWDIGKPQPVFREAAERITGSVLDLGCGTGENALMLASRGDIVTGLDFLEEPIAEAKQKAAERGLPATFLVGDALKLNEWTERFDNAIDSGLFHIFSNEDRIRYVSGLATVLKPGGRLFLLCFNGHTPGTRGPRRVTKAELHSAFAQGWEIESIEAARFESRVEAHEAFGGGHPHAWFMIARRTI